MGEPRECKEKAFLFSGILFGDDHLLHAAISRLRESWGEVILESPVSDWSHSSHYRDELGPAIKRIFLLFQRTIRPETISDVKLFTNGIESDLSANGKRTVNIDPGYLTLAKVVLATTKNYSHRIYIGKGIYTELALYYRDGSFHPMPFAYEDYKQRKYIDFFIEAREKIAQP